MKSKYRSFSLSRSVGQCRRVGHYGGKICLKSGGVIWGICFGVISSYLWVMVESLNFDQILGCRVLVCEVFSGSENCSLFKWERLFTTNELLEFVDLWLCICRVKLRPDSPDSWDWHGSSGGSFDTKGMYQSISHSDHQPEEISFLWTKIWWKVIPSKVPRLSKKQFGTRS